MVRSSSGRRDASCIPNSHQRNAAAVCFLKWQFSFQADFACPNHTLELSFRGNRSYFPEFARLPLADVKINIVLEQHSDAIAEVANHMPVIFIMVSQMCGTGLSQYIVRPIGDASQFACTVDQASFILQRERIPQILSET
jgi:hypothetical protein